MSPTGPGEWKRREAAGTRSILRRVDELDSTVGIVAMAGVAVALAGLLVCALLALRLRRVRADQRRLLGADPGEDLIARTAGLARMVDELGERLRGEVGRLAGRLDAAEERLDAAVSKTAVIRYDAFNETSGRQSSTIALLDDRDTGVLISAILQRDQARVYAKPVIEGNSALDLSPEEREALRSAGGGQR